jgi:hypothetical protein
MISLISVLGCIEENPALLNPPQQSMTMYVRFINLTRAGKPLQLSLNGAAETGLTAYGMCSDTLHPPADSANAIVLLDGDAVYQKKMKIKFLRNTYYSLIALPSAPGDSVQRDVDTIISLGTISNFTDRYNTAYIKVLNATFDTTYRYSVMLGCPNGKPLVQNLRFRGVGPAMEIYSGDAAISVLTETTSSKPDIDLFKIQLKAGGQYTLIIYDVKSEKPQMLLLDEFGGLNALKDAETVPDDERNAKIRAINFSAQQVTVRKMPDEDVARDVMPDYITSYSAITACGSQSSDTFTSIVGSDEKSTAYASLEILKNYTVAVFDSAGSSARLTVAAAPVRLSEPLNGRAVLRVINASNYYDGFTISLGARDDTVNETKFRSGELISPIVKYGEMSERVIIPSGKAPISVFTSKEPASLVFNSLTDLIPDGNYLIFILDDAAKQGKLKIALVEESDTEKTPDYLIEGAFTQVSHILPGAETITVAIPPVLTQAKLYLSGSLATVIQTGITNMTIANIQKTFTADVNKRNLILAAGSAQNPEIFVLQYDPIKVEFANYKRRFINACKEFPSVNVALNDSLTFIAENIVYGSASPVEVITLERTSSFMFINPADSTVIKRIDGLNLPFGKNFTFILGGNKSSGYTIVQQQEF